MTGVFVRFSVGNALRGVPQTATSKKMSSDLPQRKLHRLDRRVYTATQYEFSFTICARHHGTPFLNSALAEQVVDSLLWTRARYSWALFCYCLMPDHLHFGCRLTDREAAAMNGGARGRIDVGVLEHVARFKSYTTRLAWNHGLTGDTCAFARTTRSEAGAPNRFSSVTATVNESGDTQPF